MGGVRLSASLRVRIGLGVAVLALAGPNVPIAAADEAPPMPVAVDAARAALDVALESLQDPQLCRVP